MISCQILINKYVRLLTSSMPIFPNNDFFIDCLRVDLTLNKLVVKWLNKVASTHQSCPLRLLLCTFRVYDFSLPDISMADILTLKKGQNEKISIHFMAKCPM